MEPFAQPPRLPPVGLAWSLSAPRVAQLLSRDSGVRAEVEAAANGRHALPKAGPWSVTPEMLARVVERPAAAVVQPPEPLEIDRRWARGEWASPPDVETPDPAAPDAGARPAAPGEAGRPWTEAVILEYGRPALFVRDGRFALPDSPDLRRRLLPARRRIEQRLASVGRVEFGFHPTRAWGGTGWMVAERTVVTNRHVAEEFCALSGPGGTISILTNFLGRPIEARLDFREEYRDGQAQESFEVAVEKVLFLESGTKNPDVAFLRLAAGSRPLPEPIPILTTPPRDDADIVVVGYPGRDFRGVSGTEAARRIFGDVYDVKRVSPGRVLDVDPAFWYFTHDATTLGGNSGSVVLDLETGCAVGLHFMGHLHEANYAVQGQRVLDYLAGERASVAGARETLAAAPAVLAPGTAEDELVDEADEEAAEDYADREGYDAAFLGTGTDVPLPEPQGATADAVLEFDAGAGPERVLRYTHFSVMMHATRRLCLFSAVNIDGTQPVKAKRPRWRRDPRIPAGAQILQECYGAPPKFSRGHMTRREDPMWGPLAARGNADSMHATNAVPQMQPFNGGVWLGLEDFALDNARQDDMRISVFAGPLLDDADPEMYAVRIPVAFWKVIAFVHDETGALCATGYTMSQEDFLRPEEFVFGAYETYQVPIRWVEGKSGLSFGPLRDLDPFGDAEEAVPRPLQRVEQIRFVGR